MPTSAPTWDETTEVAPKWEETTAEEAGSERVAPDELATIEAEAETAFPKQPARGVIRSFGSGFAHPFRAFGMAPGIPTLPDEVLREHLEQEFRRMQAQEAPGVPARVSETLGSLGGTMAQMLAHQAVLRRVPPRITAAATFGTTGAYNAFLRAGLNALNEGKSPDEALSIAKKSAAVGAGVGAVTGAIIPQTPATFRQAAGQGAAMAGVGAGGVVTENLAERAFGLRTPVMTGVVPSAGIMGAIPPALFLLLGRGARPVPARPVPRPTEPAPPRPADVPLKLESPGTTTMKGGMDPFPIEVVDLTDKKVYGPGGKAGHVTWSGIGIVEVNTGKGVETWSKADIDQQRLLKEYPELEERRAPAERFEEEKAPDIIDAIEATIGKGAVINGKEMHAVDPNFPKNGFELNRSGYPKWFKKLFFYPKEGESKRGHPQDVLNSLQREGLFTNVEDSADAFITELFRAMEQRRSGTKVTTREQRLLDEGAAEAEAASRERSISDVLFENEERAAMAEAERLGVKARIVDKLPSDPDVPFAAMPDNWAVARVAPDGTVLLNRPGLNRFLEDVDPADRPDAIRALLHEEVVHSKVTGPEALDYWNALTGVEKALVRRRYGGPAKGRPDFTDTQLGHEALRGRLQQLAGMTPREVFGLRGVDRLTVQAILALERVIAGLRRALGTKASDLQREMLDRVQRNLDAARQSAVQSGDAPLAFHRRPGELSLSDEPGEARPTAGELSGRRAAQLSPTTISEQFDRHWTQQGRPSFKDFADELRKFEPDLQAGQLREAWTDAVWDRLLKAPGAELERLRNVLGLEGPARKELQSRAAIPDPVAPEQAAREARGVELTKETSPLGFSVEKERPLRKGEKALKTGIREYAIARIGEKLIGEAHEGRPALRRSEIKPDDIGWWRQDDQKHPAGPAYRSISLEESQNVERLGRILTQGAAVSRPTRRVDVVGREPVITRLKPTSPTVSKRVTAVLNTRTGTVDLLGTFDDHGAMIGDPLRAGRERPNVSLSNLLGRKDSSGRPLYRVLDSYLLDEPAQNFRKRFETFKDYRETFRDEVAARAAERETGGPVYAEGTEIEGGATPRSMRVPTQPEEARGAIETGGEITNAEAGAMLDHLYDNVGGKLESVEDVRFALEDLADKPNWPVIALYEKWYSSIREANKSLSPEQALDKLVSDVYETAQAAPNREAFIARALERNRPEAAGLVRPVEGATRETGARELEVRLEPAKELRRYHGTLAKQEALNAPLAFWRGAQKGGKHLAERALLEPLRLYSEWMVDRLERTGKPVVKAFAQTARRIIDREKVLYGELTPLLDPAKREAGKMSKATRWFHSFAERPTPNTAIRNSAPALEGTIPVPAFAQPLKQLADVANRAIGQLYVGVSNLTQAGGKFQRNLTGLGYDIIRRGGGDMWDSWVRGLAQANRVAIADVQKFFADWKKILDDPTSDAAAMEKVNQDFARVFPKAITDVKDPLGNWQEVVHADLFNYLETAARRATHVRAFREVFPNTPAGQASFQRAMEALRANTQGHIQDDLTDLIRALNGHPTDDYGRYNLLHPSSGWGSAFRYFNSTLGNLAAKSVLTLQMATQLGETAVGATPQSLGSRRYIRGLAKARQLWTEMERTGKRNAVMYDWSFDPHSPVRSASRIAGNVLSKGFAEQFLNEVQEGLAAVTAKIVADDIRTGALSRWDKRVLPRTFKAMGFTEAQAAEMLANRAPHLVEQFERRAAAFLTGGNKAIAEGSALGANRLFNSVFRFQNYPMMKMNQLRKVLAGVAEAKTPQERLAAFELLGRFIFGTTLQGALTTAVVTAMTEGLSGLMVKKEEAKDQPLKFVAESAISTMSGPLYLLFRGGRDGGLKGYSEQAARAFFPYSMLRDLTDMTNGQGQYRDMDTWSRLGKFVQQKMPGTKPIRVALATAGLAQADLKTEAAIRGFRRWQREQPGYEIPGTLVNDDERGRFRTAMKKAAAALQRGDKEGFLSARSEAVMEARQLPAERSAEERVAMSLRARKILQTPGRMPYFNRDGTLNVPYDLLKRLEDRIGRDAVMRLRYYDGMLEQMAEALNQAAE